MTIGREEGVNIVQHSFWTDERPEI